MVNINPKAQEMISFVGNIINPVYIVGGCVRDLVLDREPHDFDFCTPYTPDEIELRIIKAERKPIDVGKRFGTMGVHYNGTTIEITSFRKEQYKTGSRKPDVSFIANIEEDLSRRDFSINSMAMCGDKLIDPYGGVNDIKLKIIRATGNPTERFKEDPLRMLRACRFASQLGFTIEEQTFKKMCEHSHMIIGVSQERWIMELDKLLMGDYVELGLNYLFDSGLMKYMLPEMGLQYNYDQQSKYHDMVLHKHTIKVVAGTLKDINYRWAGLLHDVGKPFIAREKKLGGLGFAMHEDIGEVIVEHMALYLRFSVDRTRIVAQLVKEHMSNDSPLKDADNKAHKEGLDEQSI